MESAGVDLAASAITLGRVRASTDEQRTGYALGVAIVQTAQLGGATMCQSTALAPQNNKISGP